MFLPTKTSLHCQIFYLHAVDCVWMPWGEWGNCSRECGGGQQFRRREQLVEKYGGARCEGAATESLDCNTHNCPSEYIAHTQHIYIYCIMHNACRYTLINTLFHTLTVDGDWTVWSEWTACSVTCANGTQARSRSCTNPPPQFGGIDCEGDASDARPCFERHCPIDCEWLPFSDWSSCSKSCDIGTRERMRDYNVEKFGGEECEGDRTEVEQCNTQACPGKYCTCMQATVYTCYAICMHCL